MCNHFRMIRLKTVFPDVPADTLYDVLHDPVFRKTWDKHILSSCELGVLNPNNDLSYYALHCPAPLKNRDFVLQRSWLQTSQEVRGQKYHNFSHVCIFSITSSTTVSFTGIFQIRKDLCGVFHIWQVVLFSRWLFLFLTFQGSSSPLWTRDVP